MTFSRIIGPGAMTGEIFTMRADGTRQTNVTNSPEHEWPGVPSPNGKLIAFPSVVRERVYIMNWDGSGRRPLATWGFSAGELAWSPDGQRLAYIRNNCVLGTIDAGGAAATDLLTLCALDFSWYMDGLSWSPDGKQLAFATNKDGNYEVYTYDLATKALTNLTNNPARDRWPAWSPDSKLIAFSSNREHANVENIYVMDTLGKNVRQVTQLPPGMLVWRAWRPAWYPTGEYIFYSVSSLPAVTTVFDNGIWVVKADSASPYRLTSGLDTFPSWGPDLNRIAFERPVKEHLRALFVMNDDGTGLFQVAPTPPYQEGITLVTTMGVFKHPSWAPDRRTIVTHYQPLAGSPCEILGVDAYTRVEWPTPYSTGTEEECDVYPSVSPDQNTLAYSLKYYWGQVYVLPFDPKTGKGNHETLIFGLPRGQFVSSMRWTPDGKKLAFATNKDGNWEIYLMNPDGTGLTNLTNNPADEVDPAWSPEGSRLAFASNRGGDFDVYQLELATQTLSRLAGQDGSDERAPSYSLDGRRIAFQSNRDKNWEIYVRTISPSLGDWVNITNNPADDTNPAWGPN